jgi:uncharacterized protein (DUF488 family)
MDELLAEIERLPVACLMWTYAEQKDAIDHARRIALLAFEAAATLCEKRVTNEQGCQREDYENRQCAVHIRRLASKLQGVA